MGCPGMTSRRKLTRRQQYALVYRSNVTLFFLIDCVAFMFSSLAVLYILLGLLQMMGVHRVVPVYAFVGIPATVIILYGYVSDYMGCGFLVRVDYFVDYAKQGRTKSARYNALIGFIVCLIGTVTYMDIFVPIRPVAVACFYSLSDPNCEIAREASADIDRGRFAVGMMLVAQFLWMARFCHYFCRHKRRAMRAYFLSRRSTRG